MTEQVRFIENLLRNSEEKEQSLYYSIKIERFGEYTVVIDRSSGADMFLADMEKTIKTHKPDKIVVELYGSKSKRVKYPVNTYPLSFDKNHSNNQVQLIKPHENASEEKQLSQKGEDVIPIRQYIQETLESGRQQMQLEFNLKTLEYEIKHKDEAIVDLKKELKDREEEVKELEKELEKAIEKSSQPGLGSIAVAHVGSSLLEKFVTTKTGQALLGSLGADLDKLNGLLGVIKEEEKKETKERKEEAGSGDAKISKATIITSRPHSGKKLEDYALVPITGETRADILSHDERIDKIADILKSSEELYSMAILQLFQAIIGEGRISGDLFKFHNSIISAYNNLKKSNNASGQSTPENSSQNKGAPKIIKVEEEPDENDPDLV